MSPRAAAYLLPFFCLISLNSRAAPSPTPSLITLAETPLPIMIERQPELVVKVQVSGQVNEAGWTVNHDSRTVADTRTGTVPASFTFDLAVTGPETVVVLLAVHESGAQKERRFKINLPEWQNIINSSPEKRGKTETHPKLPQSTPGERRLQGVRFETVKFPVRVLAQGKRRAVKAVLSGTSTREGWSLDWGKSRLVECPGAGDPTRFHFEVPITGELTKIELTSKKCDDGGTSETGTYSLVFPAWREVHGLGAGSATIIADPFVREVVKNYQERKKQLPSKGRMAFSLYYGVSSLVGNDMETSARVSLSSSNHMGARLMWTSRAWRAWSFHAFAEYSALSRTPPNLYTVSSSATSFLNPWIGAKNSFLPNLTITPLLGYPEYEALTSFRDIVVTISKTRLFSAGAGLEYDLWKPNRSKLAALGSFLFAIPSGTVQSATTWSLGLQLGIELKNARRVNFELSRESQSLLGLQVNQQITAVLLRAAYEIPL